MSRVRLALLGGICFLSSVLVCSSENIQVESDSRQKAFLPPGSRHGFPRRRLNQYYKDPTESFGDPYRPQTASEDSHQAPSGWSDRCSHLDDFPTDIWTESATLDRFGGAQEHDDGSIDIYELRFKLPTERKNAEGKVELSTRFKTVEDSVMKVECVPNDADVVASVKLNVAARSSGKTARISRGVDQGSILVPFLPRGSADQFDTLSLTFDIPAGVSSSCLSFQLFLRIDTLSQVVEEFQCPPSLPASSMPASLYKIDAARGEEVHVGRDDLMITPPLMGKYSRGPSFAYPISIVVETGDVAMEAVSSFDWILSDLHLVLSDSNENIIARSNRSSALDVDGPFETSTFLKRTLSAGTYTLYVFDAMIMHVRDPTSASGTTEAGTGVCMGFSFQLDMAGGGKSPSRPRNTLMAVDPGVALHLPPSKPFTLALKFAQPLMKLHGEQAVEGEHGVRGEVTCPAEQQGAGEIGGEAFLCEDALFLFPEDIDDNADAEEELKLDVRPLRFRVMRDGSEVQVTFGAERLARGRVYLLHIEEGFFVGAHDGRVANVNKHVGVHEYAVAEECDCGGRGTCVKGRCVCEDAYAGQDCSVCAQGYHFRESGSGVACVKDQVKTTETGLVVACDRYTCNGHGNCVPQSASELECLCDAGYQTGSGGFCQECAGGYNGFPDCRPETEEEEREEEGCRLPLLPATLNQEGLLGEEGSLHLQGDYFLDPTLDSHVISFTVKQASLIRVEVDAGRHVGHIAIAVALEKRRFGAGGKGGEAVDRSRARWERVDTSGGRGSISVMVEGSEGPAKREGQEGVYRLVLAYEVLGGLDMSGEGECTSASLEMAITPMEEVQQLAGAVQGRCPTPPDSSLPMPEHVEVGPSGWSMGGCYFLSPSLGEQEGGRAMLRGTAVQFVTIEVPAVAGKLARLRAELGFRFEISHWRLMLEKDPVEGEPPACQIDSARAQSASASESSQHDVSHSSERGGDAAAPGQHLAAAGDNAVSEDAHYGEAAAAMDREDRVKEGEGKYLPSKSDESSDPYAHIYGTDAGKDGPRPPQPPPELPSPYGHIYGDGAAQGADPHIEPATPYYAVPPAGPYGDPEPHGGADADAQHAGVPSQYGQVSEADDGRDEDAAYLPVMGPDPDADEKDEDDLDFVDVIQKALAELAQGADDRGDDDDSDGFWSHLTGHDDDDDDDDGPLFRWPGEAAGEADPYGRPGGFDPYGGRPGSRDPYGAAGEDEHQFPDFGAEERWHGRRLLEAGEGRRAGKAGGGLGRGESLRCLTGRDQWNRNTLDEPLSPGRYVLWVARDPVVEGQIARQETKLTCLPLDVTIDVSFEPAPPSPATCPGRTLPTDFHEAGYLQGDIEDLHVQGEFNMRDARVKGRHFIDLRVRQTKALFRAFVQSLHPVDIRLDVFRKYGGEWEIVRGERPHIEGGLRGDSMLAVLETGEYRLQMAFVNPGGGAGMPEWDVGDGLGSDKACEVVELEIAMAGVDRLSEDAGWDRVCPDQGADRIPDPQEVGTITVGKSFNLPPRYQSVAAALFSGREGTAFSGALGHQQFVARTAEYEKGHIIGSYNVRAAVPSLLRAGVSSDFLHDDIIVQLFDTNNRLVLAGQHLRSYSHLHSIIAPGSYTLVLRQSMSAYRLLGGRGGADDWEQKTDPASKQQYWYNSKARTTQWERPPEQTGSRCAKFSFWVALDAVENGEEECRLQRGLVRSLPSSLDVPGMLGLHRTAYLQGTFPVLLSEGGERNALDTMRFTVKEKMLLRVVVASNAGEQGVMSTLKLYSSQGDDLEEQLVDAATPLGPEFKDVQWGQTDYSNRMVLTAVVGDQLDEGHSQQFVVAVQHWPVADLMDQEEVGRECPSPDKWPVIGTAMTASMYACDAASGDNNYRCIDELRTSHFLQEAEPKQKQYPVRLEELANIRVELGFQLYGPAMVVVMEHQPCPQGGAMGPCEDAGPDGKGPWGGRPMVSDDVHGGAVLNVHWVPPGRYLLSIGEQARGIAGGEGAQCVTFSFRAMVERADIQRETDGKGSPAHNLPADLHGTPYLAFLDSVHLFGRFSFPRAGTQTQKVGFHIGKAHSLLRLDAKATVGDLSVVVDKTEGPNGEQILERVRTLGLGGGPRDPRLRGSSAELLADLTQGGYVITFRYHPSDWSLRPPSRGRARGSFRLQLAISANIEVEARKDCETTEEPALRQADVGEQALHKHWRHLAWGKSSVGTLTTRRLLHTIPLKPQQPARLRVQIRSRFLSSALFVALLLPVPSDSDASVWPGGTSLPALPASAANAPPPPSCSAGYNSCELDVLLPGGPVQVAIFQPLPLPDILAHCLRYSLLVTAHPLTMDYAPGCLDQPQLPAAMAQLLGGSTSQQESSQHTGPQVLYWDWPQLTVPAGDEDTIQEVELGWVEEAAVLHVVWEEHVTGFAVDVALAAGKPVQETWQELFSYGNTLHEGTFGLKVDRGGIAVIRVKSQQRGQRHPCPLWGIQIYLRPLAAIRTAGECPSSAGKELPPTALSLNGNGFGVLEVTGYMPADSWPLLDDDRCVSNSCDRSHDISFSPSKASHLQVSLEFDPLVVSYSILLIQIQGQSSAVAATAVPAWPPPSYPPSTLKRLALTHDIPDGSYILRIARGPALGGGRGDDGARGLCSPFHLRMAVDPLPPDDSDQPMVLAMWPAGGRGLEKGKELVVRLLLSEGVDLKGIPDTSFQLRPHSSITREDWAMPREQQASNDRSKDAGHILTSAGNVGIEEDATAVVGGGYVLVLRFPAAEVAKAAAGEDYVLWFKDAHFEVEDGDTTRAIGTHGAVVGVRTREAFMQPPPWTFTFTERVCSGRGKKGAYGLCDCENGRAGWECEACRAEASGCVAEEKENGIAEDVVIQGGERVAEAQLELEAKAEVDEKKERQQEHEIGKSAPAEADTKEGWQGDFHYKNELSGDGEGDASTNAAQGHDPTNPYASIYGEASGSDGSESRQEHPNMPSPYGHIYGDAASTDGPYGDPGPYVAPQHDKEVENGPYGNVEAAAVGPSDNRERGQASGAGGQESDLEGPVVNADGSVDAESMAAWERAQRQKRQEASAQGRLLAAGEGQPSLGKEGKAVGILCSFLTCHDDAGWSMGWLVGGVGLVGVAIAASLCFVRRRFRRNHDSYRMLRFDDDDL